MKLHDQKHKSRQEAMQEDQRIWMLRSQEDEDGTVNRLRGRASPQSVTQKERVNEENISGLGIIKWRSWLHQGCWLE